VAAGFVVDHPALGRASSRSSDRSHAAQSAGGTPVRASSLVSPACPGRVSSGPARQEGALQGVSHRLAACVARAPAALAAAAAAVPQRAAPRSVRPWQCGRVRDERQLRMHQVRCDAGFPDPTDRGLDRRGARGGRCGNGSAAGSCGAHHASRRRRSGNAWCSAAGAPGPAPPVPGSARRAPATGTEHERGSGSRRPPLFIFGAAERCRSRGPGCSHVHEGACARAWQRAASSPRGSIQLAPALLPITAAGATMRSLAPRRAAGRSAQQGRSPAPTLRSSPGTNT